MPRSIPRLGKRQNKYGARKVEIDGTYSPDFQYQVDGELVVEDVKGRATLTTLYRWKKRHMMAEHGIEVREVYYNYRKKTFSSK